MRRFIYFCRGLSGSPSREQFIRVSKLAYAFPKSENFQTCEMRDGSLGAGVLAACGDGVGVKYDPAAQSAELISEGVYVLVPKDRNAIPGPNELLRSTRSLDGNFVQLADGETWRVPIIRFLDGNTQLPRVLMKRGGKPEWSIHRDYEDLFAAAERIVSDLLEGNQTAYDPAEMLWFVSRALQVNYRIGETEIAAMGLIGSENIREIADAALDGPKLAILMEEFKKKHVVRDLSGMASATGEGG